MLPPVRVYGRNMEAVVATKYLHTAPHTALRMELPSEGDIRGLEHILGRLRQSPDNRLCYQDAARAWQQNNKNNNNILHPSRPARSYAHEFPRCL